MEANCFVKNASLLTFDILKTFMQRFTFTRNGVKATQLPETATFVPRLQEDGWTYLFS